METSASDYGKHLFSTMLSKKGSSGDHWESIREKAEPLVWELLKLNKEMKGGGYKLTGYVDESGKEQLPDHERIDLAQRKLWSVPVTDLKEGDKIWLLDGEPEMYVQETRPGVVEEVTKKSVYVELYDWEEYTEKLVKRKDYFVLRAPKDWDKKEELYTSDEYWLKEADKLGF